MILENNGNGRGGGRRSLVWSSRDKARISGNIARRGDDGSGLSMYVSKVMYVTFQHFFLTGWLEKIGGEQGNSAVVKVE